MDASPKVAAMVHQRIHCAAANKIEPRNADINLRQLTAFFEGPTGVHRLFYNYLWNWEEESLRCATSGFEEPEASNLKIVSNPGCCGRDDLRVG
jgi:hypothetical protein